MQILKAAEKKVPWSFEFTCPECEALLLIEEGDTTVSKSKHDLRYGTYIIVQCKCISCHHTMIIPCRKLPGQYLSYLSDTYPAGIIK